MQSNQLRLTNLGGRRGRNGHWRSCGQVEQLASRLPAMLLTMLERQQARLAELTKDIVAIELRLKGWAKTNAPSRRLQDIPGVGLLTATAAVAMIGEAKHFRSGRVRRCLGLVPRQSTAASCWGSANAVTCICAPC
ncbi:MAG: transposase [Betaproteobacteria bacterium]|nr:transposase [Betaproteobacteria bacterium]